MIYYLLNRSLERKEVGVAFGQTDQIWDLDFISGVPYIEQLMKLPNWHGNLTNDEFPTYEPRIKFELTEKGKLSDLVDIPMMTANGLFLSPKFKTLLEYFNLMEHRFYPGKLKVGEFVKEYFWFHPKANYFEWFDFEKSEVHFELEEDEPIFINSLEQYKNYHKKGYINVSKICFNKQFPNLDLFCIPHLNRRTEFFISEQLMNIIKKEKITGIEIKEQFFI